MRGEPGQPPRPRLRREALRRAMASSCGTKLRGPTQAEDAATQAGGPSGRPGPRTRSVCRQLDTHRPLRAAHGPSSWSQHSARGPTWTAVARHRTGWHHGSAISAPRPGPRWPPLRPHWPQRGDAAGGTPLRPPSSSVHAPHGRAGCVCHPRAREDSVFHPSSGTDEDASLLGVTREGAGGSGTRGLQGRLP